MNRTHKIWLLLTLVVMAAWSCTKHEQYPIEPVIEFYSFTKIANNYNVDDQAILSISFTDGDGDIGIDDWDTLPPYNFNSPYYYNCFIEYFEKQNGQFVKVDLPISNYSRIPRVEADLPERGIRGNIEVELFINNVLSSYDTVKFSMFIYDRALHKSNTIETPEIVIDKKP